MAKTDPTKPKCTRCLKRQAQVIYKGMCQRCYVELVQAKKNAAAADETVLQGDDEWKKLIVALRPTIEAVAKGEIKASAAQAAMLKEVLSRGLGKVTKSQEDAAGPSGVVVLPTLDEDVKMQVCPKCREYHASHG